MGTTTLWVLGTWTKATLLLLVLVGGAWLYLGSASGWFWVVVGGALLTEWYVIRQLAREWSWEARSTWWWSP